MSNDLPARVSFMAPQIPAGLSPEYEQLFAKLVIKGTPINTLRTYNAHLKYIQNWKLLSFGEDLSFPERDDVVLQFILDHTDDLREMPKESRARRVGERMIALHLRQSPAAHKPGTMDSKLAVWRILHAWHGVRGPFSNPAIRLARRKHSMAMRGTEERLSPNPITEDVLNRLLEVVGGGLIGMRNRAMLQFAFKSGGRRRSEVSALQYDDLDLSRFDQEGLVLIRMKRTKTSGPMRSPPVVLKHDAARDLVAWIDAAGIKDGPVFRAFRRPTRDSDGKMLKDGICGGHFSRIVRQLLAKAGYPKAFASAHGLRSGFMTEAARRGVPMAAAMAASQHRTVAIAARYYHEVEVEKSIVADMFAPSAQARLAPTEAVPAYEVPQWRRFRRRGPAGEPDA